MKNIDKLIKNITDRTMLGGKDWCMDIDKWDWNPGVGLFGVFCAYSKTGTIEYLSFLENWFDKNSPYASEKRTINSTAPFITKAELYRVTGKKKYLDMCIENAEWLLNDADVTSYGGLEHTVTESGVKFREQIWADTLFMTCIFMAKLFNITKENKYRDFVINQFVIHHRKLRNRSNGLYYHGYDGVCDNHMSSAFWARANAWMILSSYIIIDEIGEFEGVSEIYDYIRQQSQTLKKSITDEGGFKTVLDVDDIRNYEEMSATAGIAAGLRLWQKKNVLGDDFNGIVKRAENKVISRINNQGELCDVSCGTPVMESIKAYFSIPKAPTLYGQGLALAMLCIE